MEAIAWARSSRDRPVRLTTPYSVATYWIMVRGAETTLADRLAEARAKGDVELFFVEAALLIENGFGEVVDEMWYIYAREEVRRKRLSVSRGYTPEKIDRIMSSQLSENEFRKHCDFVIDNSDSLENSYRQIRQKLEAYTWRE